MLKKTILMGVLLLLAFGMTSCKLDMNLFSQISKICR